MIESNDSWGLVDESPHISALQVGQLGYVFTSKGKMFIVVLNHSLG